MKLRSLVVAVFASALATVAAQAQIGLYITPEATRISNSTADTGPFAFLGQNSTSQMFYGATIGGYYDFFQSTQGLHVGIDVRDSIVHGNNAALNSFLVGVRFSGKPASLPFRPYFQGSVGAATSRAPTNSLHVTRATYAAFVGADYPINRHIDWRVLEIGYGSATTVSSNTVGGTSSVPSASLLHFSTGIVFRIR
jgi:hypothetical protein